VGKFKLTLKAGNWLWYPNYRRELKRTS